MMMVMMVICGLFFLGTPPMICRATLPDKVVSHQGGDDAIMMMVMMVMMIKMMVMMTCRIVDISDHFCGNHGFSGMTTFLMSIVNLEGF